MSETLWAAYRRGEYLFAGTADELAEFLDVTLAERRRIRAVSPQRKRLAIREGLVMVRLRKVTEVPRSALTRGHRSEEAFDRACAEMRADAYGISETALALGVTQAVVRGALRRVDSGRYEGVA